MKVNVIMEIYQGYVMQNFTLALLEYTRSGEQIKKINIIIIKKVVRTSSS